MVALLIDAATSLGEDRALTRREIALAASVIAEGRALVVVVNKLDALREGLRPQVQCPPFS